MIPYRVLSQASELQHLFISSAHMPSNLLLPFEFVLDFILAFIPDKGASESAIEEGEARALALAQAFKSSKPSFIRRVYPSHVDGTQHGMVTINICFYL